MKSELETSNPVAADTNCVVCTPTTFLRGLVIVTAKAAAMAILAVLIWSGMDALADSGAGYNVFVAWPAAHGWREHAGLVALGCIALGCLGLLGFLGWMAHRHWLDLATTGRGGRKSARLEQLGVLGGVLVVFALLGWEDVDQFVSSHPAASLLELLSLAWHQSGMLAGQALICGVAFIFLMLGLAGFLIVMFGAVIVMFGSMMIDITRAICSAGQPARPLTKQPQGPRG